MNLFTSAIFTQGILPFLLVFVLVFAILQRSKIFGEGKSQIDALISLAIGLILIGVKQPRDLIVRIVPWLAVALIVVFIIIVIYGMGGEYDSDPKKGLKIPKWFNKTILIVAIIFVVALVLILSGGWSYIKSQLSSNSSMFSNIILIIVIGVALWIVLGNKTKDDS